MEINLRGYRQVVGGGIMSPGGTKNPGVEGDPQEYKTSGVTPEGNRVPGRDRRGLGEDKNSPATRENEGAKTVPRLSMYSDRHGLAAQLRLHRYRKE